jgi:hypothetical protein
MSDILKEFVERGAKAQKDVDRLLALHQETEAHRRKIERIGKLIGRLQAAKAREFDEYEKKRREMRRLGKETQ